jgi:hypothetical protein
VALAVDATSIRGVWFRQIPASGDPLFRSDPPPDGRWQRGEAIEGFYLADDEQTVWAEWYRRLEELGIPPEHELPRELWSFDVELDRVADLSDTERLSVIGLPAPKPSRRQWPPFQSIGEQLHSDGYSGILYQSTAWPAGQALCPFRESHELAGITAQRLVRRHEKPSPNPIAR